MRIVIIYNMGTTKLYERIVDKENVRNYTGLGVPGYLLEKKEKKERKKSLQHWVFEFGHPTKY